MRVGDKVEVFCRFTGSWAPGFVVEAVESGGYRLRRLSDGSVLPDVTHEEDLRPLAHA